MTRQAFPYKYLTNCTCGFSCKKLMWEEVVFFKAVEWLHFVDIRIIIMLVQLCIVESNKPFKVHGL